MCVGVAQGVYSPCDFRRVIGLCTALQAHRALHLGKRRALVSYRRGGTTLVPVVGPIFFVHRLNLIIARNLLGTEEVSNIFFVVLRFHGTVGANKIVADINQHNYKTPKSARSSDLRAKCWRRDDLSS